MRVAPAHPCPGTGGPIRSSDCPAISAARVCVSLSSALLLRLFFTKGSIVSRQYRAERAPASTAPSAPRPDPLGSRNESRMRLPPSFGGACSGPSFPRAAPGPVPVYGCPTRVKPGRSEGGWMEGWWCVRYGDALAWVEARRHGIAPVPRSRLAYAYMRDADNEWRGVRRIQNPVCERVGASTASMCAHPTGAKNCEWNSGAAREGIAREPNGSRAAGAGTGAAA